MADLYVGDPAEQRVNVPALITVVCHPWHATIWVSALRWNDPVYVVRNGCPGFASVWPADREAVRKHFGGLPGWPGEYMERDDLPQPEVTPEESRAMYAIVREREEWNALNPLILPSRRTESGKRTRKRP